jgi:hypothetical protein
MRKTTIALVFAAGSLLSNVSSAAGQYKGDRNSA